jgi:hypothetical protein
MHTCKAPMSLVTRFGPLGDGIQLTQLAYFRVDMQYVYPRRCNTLVETGSQIKVNGNAGLGSNGKPNRCK